MLGVTGCTGGYLRNRVCGGDWDGDWVAHGVTGDWGLLEGLGYWGHWGLLGDPSYWGTAGYWKSWDGDWVLWGPWGLMGTLGVTREAGGHWGLGWGLVALQSYWEDWVLLGDGVHRVSALGTLVVPGRTGGKWGPGALRLVGRVLGDTGVAPPIGARLRLPALSGRLDFPAWRFGRRLAAPGSIGARLAAPADSGVALAAGGGGGPRMRSAAGPGSSVGVPAAAAAMTNGEGRHGGGGARLLGHLRVPRGEEGVTGHWGAGSLGRGELGGLGAFGGGGGVWVL